MKCKASDRDDPTEDPRFGRVGKQTIEDTGPLTRKRMETVDEEFLGATLDVSSTGSTGRIRPSSAGRRRDDAMVRIRRRPRRRL
jgi:hypothetical protein